MEMQDRDYVLKALLDTQERIRDYGVYADKIQDGRIGTFFRECAVHEGHQATHLKQFLEELS